MACGLSLQHYPNKIPHYTK